MTKRKRGTCTSPTVYKKTQIPEGSLPHWAKVVRVQPLGKAVETGADGRPKLVNVWPLAIVRAIKRVRGEGAAAATA